MLTNTYALIPRIFEELQYFVSLNIDAKFLLLYRIPISRIISAVNYLIENKKDEKIAGQSVNDLYLNYAKVRHVLTGQIIRVFIIIISQYLVINSVQ